MISLTLPRPPSANRNTRFGKSNVHKSNDYKNWLKEAGWAIKAKRLQGIQGPYHLALKVAPRRNKGGELSGRQMDLDNHLKPVCDALQAFGLIENDKFARTIYMEWSDAESGVWVEFSEAVAA